LIEAGLSPTIIGESIGSFAGTSEGLGMGPWWAVVPADLAPFKPGEPLQGNNLVFYGAVAAAAVALLLLLLFLRRRPAPVDPEAGLAEDLATYPPAPGAAGPKQLTVQGQPVRVRLAVVAPVGRQKAAEDGAVEPLLERVVRGLGAAARQDRARVREWPPGLSSAGFTPAFFRRVVRPEPAGTPSHWILLAGPARAGARQVLLGLALWADGPNRMGNVAVQQDEWNELLRLETV
jgi:hypothetical protein